LVAWFSAFFLVEFQRYPNRAQFIDDSLLNFIACRFTLPSRRRQKGSFRLPLPNPNFSLGELVMGLRPTRGHGTETPFHLVIFHNREVKETIFHAGRGSAKHGLGP
jgi:hypothetical protein